MLITRVVFTPGLSNGANLAALLRLQKPRLRLILLATSDMQEHVVEFGVVMPLSMAIPELVEAARGCLAR